MDNIEEIINETELECSEEVEVDEVIDDNKLMAYDIAVFYNTYNLSTLMKWWGKKLIIPEFQRSYVWNMRKASEFVDSILRGLPVPSMFFYDDIDNSRYLVVDGQQRLNSLYSYIEKKSYGDKKFALVGNIHPKWKGLSFDELEDEDRDRLEDALLNITLMRQLAPDDGQSSMYLAFQRINTGGVMLKAQEIRMAVSYGPLAKYIFNMAQDSRFEKWKFLRTDAQRKNNNYSKIQELLLKFYAYYFSYDEGFSGSSTRVMIDEFFDAQKDFDAPKRKLQSINYHSEAEFQEAFEAAFEIIYALDIELLQPYTRPTQTYLEAIWVGLTYRILKLGKDINTEKLPEIIRCWKDKIGDQKFSELFQARRTSSVQSAYDRIDAGIKYFAGDFDA